MEINFLPVDADPGSELSDQKLLTSLLHLHKQV